VTEDVDANPNGWVLERIQCSGGKQNVQVNLATGSVTILPTAGDEIRCTFWNTLPRITGGGSVFTGAGGNGQSSWGSWTANTRVTHGFNLYCGDSAKHNANNLEINWQGKLANGKTVSNNFHLEKLNGADVICNGPATGGSPTDPEMPNAPFSIHNGSGTGQLNNSKNADYYARWIIRDNGEPGRNDTWNLEIYQLNGAPVPAANGVPGGASVLVISFNSLNLDQGNHQAH
jgi:hypothetical protein